MKKRIRVLCALLCAIFMSQTVTPLLSVVAGAAGSSGAGTSDAMLAILADDTLNASKVVDTVTYHEEYLGCDVGLTTYYADIPMTAPDTYGVPVMLYVVGTAAERIGTDSDTAIIGRLLSRGFIVTVVDYRDNPAAISPALDWSLQELRGYVAGGTMFRGKDPIPQYSSYGENLIIPAGYDVLYNSVFWEIDKHGADGTFDKIVEIWNNDFRGTKGSNVIKWVREDGTQKRVENAFDGTEPVWYADATASKVDPNGSYTRVKWTIAEEITDCVRVDGTPVDLNLYLHVVYPTNPGYDVPVYCLASSSEKLADAWSYHGRPHLTGFAFSGYAVMTYDYGYVPMARVDHYGYYDGNDSAGHVTGANNAYSINIYNEKKSNTAALRFVRYLSDADHDTYSFDVDHIGVLGNSKAGVVTFLGEPHPELQAEQAYLVGHHGETRYEAGKTETVGIIDGGKPQPFLTYKNGDPIPSNANFVYAATGGEGNQIGPDHAPTYVSGTMQSNGSYWSTYHEFTSACYANDVPCLGFAIENLGHTLASGIDKDYGVDTYDAYFYFANYYLKGDPAHVMYISPVGGSTGVGTTDPIVVKFAGQVTASEIVKVTVTDTLSGKTVSGAWTSAYGNTEWTFHPTEPLRGDTVIRVDVPNTIIDEKNGKPLANSLSISFLTVCENTETIERKAGADTVNFDDGVVIAYTKKASTTEDWILRFGVKDAATNKAEIYLVTQYCEDNPLNSDLDPTPFAIVGISGAGVYSADITEIVKEMEIGETVYFGIWLAKDPGTETVTHYDFEDETVGETVAVTPGISTVHGVIAVDPTDPGNKTLSGGTFDLSNYYKNAYTADGLYPYHNYKGGMACTFATIEASITPTDAVIAEDLGRVFRITFRVYDTVSRRVYISMPSMTSQAYDVLDFWRLGKPFETKAGEWVECEAYFTVYQPAITSSPLIRVTVTIAADSTGNLDLPFYLDDYTVEEKTTTAQIGLAYVSTHPTVTSALAPTASAAINPDGTVKTEIGEVTVGVQDSYRTNGVTKAYFKYSLGNVSGEKPVIAAFSASGGNRGKLYLYGLPFDTEWDPETINALNAPANDRGGAGVVEAQTWGGAPLATFEYDGSVPVFEADVTEFALAAKAAGKSEISVVLVSDFASVETLWYCDFDHENIPIYIGAGGGSSTAWMTHIDADDFEGKEGGRVFAFTQYSKYYERMRMDVLNTTGGRLNEQGSFLTESDIGRTFRVSFKCKLPELDTAADLVLGLIYGYSGGGYGSPSAMINDVSYPLVPGEWVDIEYVFTVTSSIVKLRQHHLCVQTSKCQKFPMPIYFDNFRVEELSYGAVTVSPYMGETVAHQGFEARKFLNRSEASREVNPGVDYCSNGVKNYAWAPSKADDPTAIDHTDGVGRVFRATLDKITAQYRFYNIFPQNLTEEDIGKKYRLVFFAKADTEILVEYGLVCSSPSGEYYANYYGGATKGKVLPGDYTQLSFDFTVTADMIAKSDTDYTNPALFGLSLNTNTEEWPENYIFRDSAFTAPYLDIDDLTLILTYDPAKDIPEDPTPAYDATRGYERGTALRHVSAGDSSVKLNGQTYTYKIGPESTASATDYTVSSAAKENFLINTDSRYIHTGTGSLSVLFNEKRNPRFKIYDIFGKQLTAADVGKEYEISWYSMTDGPEDFRYRVGFMTCYDSDMTLTDKNGATVSMTRGYMYDPTKDEVFSQYDYNNNAVAGAGEWKLNTMRFIITEAMVAECAAVRLTDDDGKDVTFDVSYSILGIVAPVWQKYYGEDTNLISKAHVFIDDLRVREVRPIKKDALDVTAAAQIGGDGTSREVRRVGQVTDNAGVSKAETLRVVFPPVSEVYGRRYVLRFTASETNGETLKIYGIPGDTAADANLYKLYNPDKPLAAITLDHDGEYTVDVTDFALSAPGKAVYFLFTSDAVVGKEHYALDLSTAAFTEGTDYTVKRGAVTVANRKLNVPATGSVRLYNLFGSGDATAEAGNYTVTIRLRAAKADNVSVALCKSGSTSSISGTSKTFTLAKNVETVIEYCFDASKKKPAGILFQAAVDCEITSISVTSSLGSFSLLKQDIALLSVDAERSYETTDEITADAILSALCDRGSTIAGAPVDVRVTEAAPGVRTLPEKVDLTLDLSAAELSDGAYFRVNGPFRLIGGAENASHFVTSGGDVGIDADGNAAIYRTLPKFSGQLTVSDAITLTVTAPDGYCFGNGENTVSADVSAPDAYLPISFTFTREFAGKTVTFARRYSVRSYLNALLKADVSQEEHKLAEKFRNYIYYAAVLYDEAGTLAEEFAAEGFLPTAPGTVPEGQEIVATEHIKAASLTLGVRPTVNFYLTAAEGEATVRYTGLTGDVTLTFDLSACKTQTVDGVGECRVVSFEVSAFNMNTAFEIAFGEESLTYTLCDYIKGISDKTDAAFAVALYEYADAAHGYVAASGV